MKQTFYFVLRLEKQAPLFASLLLLYSRVQMFPSLLLVATKNFVFQNFFCFSSPKNECSLLLKKKVFAFSKRILQSKELASMKS